MASSFDEFFKEGISIDSGDEDSSIDSVGNRESDINSGGSVDGLGNSSGIDNTEADASDGLEDTDSNTQQVDTNSEASNNIERSIKLIIAYEKKLKMMCMHYLHHYQKCIAMCNVLNLHGISLTPSERELVRKLKITANEIKDIHTVHHLKLDIRLSLNHLLMIM